MQLGLSFYQRCGKHIHSLIINNCKSGKNPLDVKTPRLIATENVLSWSAVMYP